MRILVTGGSGFIGSHIVDEYISHGHQVAVVDDLSTGDYRVNANKAKFYFCDIRDEETLDRIFEVFKPNVVNHHAAVVDTVRSNSEPAETLAINVAGTANVLSAFSKHCKGKKKFIFASSVGVYGDVKKLPVSEAVDTNPMSMYGISKLSAEIVIKNYCRENNIEYCIFRYANVYGPRQKALGEGGVVAIFKNLMQKSQTPIIYGDGLKTRDYVYVGDIAKASLLALTKGKNVILNLSTGKGTKDIDVYSAIAASLSFKKKPKYKKIRKGEILHSRIDSTLAAKTLGWKYSTEFANGVLHLR